MDKVIILSVNNGGSRQDLKIDNSSDVFKEFKFNTVTNTPRAKDAPSAPPKEINAL